MNVKKKGKRSGGKKILSLGDILFQGKLLLKHFKVVLFPPFTGFCLNSRNIFRVNAERETHTQEKPSWQTISDYRMANAQLSKLACGGEQREGKRDRQIPVRSSFETQRQRQNCGYC